MMNNFLSSLDERLADKSDWLEEIHFEAAIDAQLTATCATRRGGKDCAGDSRSHLDVETASPALFDDYVNPHSVANCLSPYVPTNSKKISAFISLAGLRTCDVLLDIGCGDGRVCVAAAKLIGCCTMGLDISPPCIERAQELATEEGVEELCHFYNADATADLNHLLGGSSQLASRLQAVTVVWLFTYPTLLRRLVPLLSSLQKAGARIVTLTYHLADTEASIEMSDTENDLCLYSCIHI